MPDPPRPHGPGIAIAGRGSDHAGENSLDRDSIDPVYFQTGQVPLIRHVFAQRIDFAVRHFHIEREKWNGLRDRRLNISRRQNCRMTALDLRHHRR